jgi:hypothetical protein
MWRRYVWMIFAPEFTFFAETVATQSHPTGNDRDQMSSNEVSEKGSSKEKTSSQTRRGMDYGRW